MAVFKVETKNKVDIDKKPRVYFTCHPDDFEKYFKKVCDDIFKTHDCAIYYTEDMSEVIADDEKQVDLGRNNLFVIPVTFKLLTTPNRAMDEDIPYALKEHIPVLPIMMEPGIDEFYSKPDKFGELQYLNPYTTDLTEISYEEKLKKYLESVLISDDLAKRVRAAFDAYIFLSYRKKDRKYANELMRLIHSNPECRDIAIWFDEFLTPGESFKENIEKILDDCKLFTLLVTPQLLEKVVDENGEERDNYVISTELPLARKKKQEKGTDIFAVEMEKTDREALSSISIEDYTNPENADFRARLLETISRIAVTTNNTPEHNFLIGLAYLEGIDVEVDRERGIELITSAALEKLPEAMIKLYNVYDSGDGQSPNYEEALKWAEILAEHSIAVLGEEDDTTLKLLHNLVIAYNKAGLYEKAIELAQRIYNISCKTFGKNNIITLEITRTLASTYYELGNYEDALYFQENSYEICCEHIENGKAEHLNSMCFLAMLYAKIGEYTKADSIICEACRTSSEQLGDEHPDALTAFNIKAAICVDLGNYDKALELTEKVYTIRSRILGDKHPDTITSLNNLAMVYSDIGKHYESLFFIEKAYLISCEVLGDEHPSTLCSLNNLATCYSKVGNLDKALELAEKAYTIRSRTLGDKHPDTIVSLNNLAMMYNDIGNSNKALELLEIAIKVYRTHFSEEHVDVLSVLSNMAIIHKKLGNKKQAFEIVEKVYELRCKILGENHPATLTTLLNFAELCLQRGRFLKAWKLCNKGLKILKK